MKAKLCCHDCLPLGICCDIQGLGCVLRTGPLQNIVLTTVCLKDSWLLTSFPPQVLAAPLLPGTIAVLSKPLWCLTWHNYSSSLNMMYLLASFVWFLDLVVCPFVSHCSKQSIIIWISMIIWISIIICILNIIESENILAITCYKVKQAFLDNKMYVSLNSKTVWQTGTNTFVKKR